MFHILWTLIIGLVVGAVAKAIMGGRDPGGIVVTMLLGIAGAFVGHWLGRMAGFYAYGQPAGFVMSVVGAIVILAVYHAIRRG